MKIGKKMIQRTIENVAIKIASVDANTACPCISYQPKLPKAVEKLRKP